MPTIQAPQRRALESPSPTPRHWVGVRPLVEAVYSLTTPPAFDPLEPRYHGLRYRVGRAPGIAPLADVYLPEGRGPHPSVVLVHGGAFLIGHRRMKPMRFLATRLCEAGYAVATFDYRLLLRGGRLDEQVADVRAMLRWWHAQQGAFRLDPRRVSACGLSAGGTLLLLATSKGPVVPLARLISVFALYDLAGLKGRFPQVMCRLLMASSSRREWARRSPLARPACGVPMTILHGTHDGLTPLEQAHAYRAKRDAVGLETELHVYSGAPHGFFNDARAPVASEALADLLAALEY